MTAMRIPALTEIDSFSLSLLLALLFHGFLLMVHFEFEQDSGNRLQQALEITLVRNPRPAESNDKPDFLAQTSQLGGGDREEKQPPKTEQAPPAVAPQEQPPQPLMEPGLPEASQPTASITRPEPAKKPKREKPRRSQTKPTTRAGALLASRDREIARLTAELDFQFDAATKQPRRKFVSASTQEYKYASYLQAWRKKVEKVGTLNFPDEAKRKKLYGNLVLQVALNRDGSIEDIQLRKSSGHKVLDDAAIRIVRLAAPFAPFPANIAAETDILEITRTWQFVSGQPLFRNN